MKVGQIPVADVAFPWIIDYLAGGVMVALMGILDFIILNVHQYQPYSKDFQRGKKFILLSNEEKYRCRVCGLLYPEPPWGEDGQSPTFDYCECCGVEFGYGDSSILGIRKHRERWIAEGAIWFEPKLKPIGWKLEEQLKMIPEEYL